MYTLSILLALFCILQHIFVNSLVYSVDEKMENCNNGSLRFFDLSTINITMVGDTETTVNGEIVFTQEMFKKTCDDFCFNLRNPTEM